MRRVPVVQLVGGWYVPVSEVIGAEFHSKGVARVDIRGEPEFCTLANVRSEAEMLAALGWSNGPPPPHPTAREVLAATAAVQREGVSANDRLQRAIEAWVDAGCPGADRVAP